MKKFKWLNWMTVLACGWSVAFSLNFDNPLMQVSSVVIAIFGITIIHKRNIPIHNGIYVYALFLIGGLLSSVINNSFDSKFVAYILVLPVALFFNYLNEKEHHSVNYGLALGGIIFGIISLYLFKDMFVYFGDDAGLRLDTTLNPNAIAYIVSMSALLLIIKTPKLCLKSVFALIALAVLLATRSKTGLGLYVISVFMIWLMSTKGKTNKLLLITISSLFLAMLAWINLDFIQQFFQIDTTRSLADGTGRTAGWNFLINRYLDSDLVQVLLGKGAGKANYDIQGMNTSAHNAWITIVYDFGLIGGVLQGLLVVVAMLNMEKKYYPLVLAALIETMFEINYIGLGNIGSILYISVLFKKGIVKPKSKQLFTNMKQQGEI
ncbi:MAG: hypothetical protein GX801_08205 [Fibrobacter sp.]|nr:hypothetical protein [Fibrobacter sp.]